MTFLVDKFYKGLLTLATSSTLLCDVWILIEVGVFVEYIYYTKIFGIVLFASLRFKLVDKLKCMLCWILFP